MNQKFYQVDSFTDKLFAGNPAGVCPLEAWLPDETMQNIAAENNLSETAFYISVGDQYEIRWFTPTIEVDLCGHATLAAAFVLFNHEGHKKDIIEFLSPRSGRLTVSRDDKLMTLNFPTDTIIEIPVTNEVIYGLNIEPERAYRGKTDVVLVYNTQEDVENLTPDFLLLAKINARGVIVTAPGNNTDFVSRFFGPNAGVNEDPVTGSAHTSLTPYWTKALGKNKLTAKQLSSRGGSLECTFLNDRVEISGQARLYLKGEIFIS